MKASMDASLGTYRVCGWGKKCTDKADRMLLVRDFWILIYLGKKNTPAVSIMNIHVQLLY
jgi:hypothetical protein